ncbi:MAG: zinc finger domain-containing protein [Candidatus Aenigmatarchaeota archaeon]
MKCTSCGINILSKKNFVKFMCPDCGKTEIRRCSTCKNLGTKYECECGFIGP